jgi:SAM-dependent methyltransferase
VSAFYTAVARYFDAENADKTDDLQLYSRLADQYPGQILDIGCGSGRILIHLAQRGHNCCGIDNDAAMLALFNHKLDHLPQLRQSIDVTEADVLRHEYRQTFSLILLSYNALMHFHEQDEQIALLRRLRAGLNAGGRLVIDLPNAGPIFASPDNDALTLERTFLDRDSGHLVMLQSVSYLDRAAQLLDVEWIYDVIDGDGGVKRTIVPHKLRYFFLPELKLLLAHAGLALDAVYGDTDQSVYDADAERMIVLAKCD